LLDRLKLPDEDTAAAGRTTTRAVLALFEIDFQTETVPGINSLARTPRGKFGHDIPDRRAGLLQPRGLDALNGFDICHLFGRFLQAIKH
jgi:hypothetical protein